MKQLWLVARREILVRGKSKSYISGVIVTAVLVGVLAILPTVLGGGGEDDYSVGVTGTDAAALTEEITRVTESSDLDIEMTSFDTEEAAEQAINDGDVEAVLVDNSEVMAEGSPNRALMGILENAHQTVVMERQFADEGIDPDQAREAMQVEALSERSLDGDDAAARQAIAYFLIIVLMMMVMMPAIYVAMGVVEEKSSRIVEILLASVKPWQLLGGKIVGLGVLGLINLGVPLLVGLFVGMQTGAVGLLPSGIATTLLTALGWWALGFAFFAAMAGALGSLVSRQEEVSSALAPMSMLIMAGYLVSAIYTWNPTATVAQVLSFIPPFSMFMMPIRDAVGDAPLWQQGVSALLMALAAMGVLGLGAAIYRRTVMHTGSKLKLTEVMTKGA